MKEKFRSGRAVISFVGAVFFAAGLFADDTTRTKNVLVVNNEAWQTGLAVVAEDGEATVRISDCGDAFGGELTARFPYGGGLFVPNITDYQCSGTKLGVIKLRVLSGEPRLWTQASYRDSIGNRNVVMLPTLPDALPRSYSQPTFGFTAEYVFEGIENASTFGKSTFVALIPDGEGETQVELSVSSYSEGAASSVTEIVTIDRFTFYELKTPVEFGRLLVKHVAPANASGTEPGLFAVAFIGDREAGSPRVEVPRTRLAVFSE